jgi:hypothetical protein
VRVSVQVLPQSSGVDAGHEQPPPPLAQLWFAGHALHDAPCAPHSFVFCAVVTHPLLSQHPSGHEAASHATHDPAEQMLPAAQGRPSLMLLGEEHTGPFAQDIVPD